MGKGRAPAFLGQSNKKRKLDGGAAQDMGDFMRREIESLRQQNTQLQQALDGAHQAANYNIFSQPASPNKIVPAGGFNI